MSAPGLPVLLTVANRRCVVVGGGAVGARRARTLRDAGAVVVVVDPRPVAIEGVEHVASRFVPEHLEGAFAVVIATDDAAVNALAADTARRRGILVNAAAPGEGSDAGDFAVMASVARGPLRVGVAGGGPIPSGLVRDRIDALLEPGVGIWAEELEALRHRLHGEESPAVDRVRTLREVASDGGVWSAVAAGDADAIRTAIGDAARRHGASRS